MKGRLLTALLPGLLGPIAAIFCLDALGGWALRRLEASRRQDITAYEQRVSMSRPVLNAPPVGENAALWYKRAIATAASRLSQADNVALGRDYDDLEALEKHFVGRCVDTEPLLRGARCISCNWGPSLQEPKPIDSTAIMPARFLAYCLVQEGARRAEASDWQAAFVATFATLRFAADLKLTNLLGSLIAIDVAQMGLAGLGRLMTRLDHQDTLILPTLERDLAEFEPHVLGLGEGPRTERLQLLSLLESEAQQQAAAGRRGLGRLVPWSAVTAYRMHEVDNLLRQAETAATGGDYEVRLQLAKAVNAKAASSWSPTLRAVGPPQWFRVREKADRLVERYRLVQIAVRLEECYGLHRRYPDNTSSLPLPFEVDGLQYEASADRQGYRLQYVHVGSSVRESAKPVLERRR